MFQPNRIEMIEECSIETLSKNHSIGDQSRDSKTKSFKKLHTEDDLFVTDLSAQNEHVK